MAAPRAAQEQLKRAEQLHREMYGDPNAPAKPEAEDTPTEPEATTEPENEPEPQEPAPAADPEPEQQPEPEAPKGHADEEDLKERYRKLDAAYSTLQGKYRAEVPRLQEQVRTLQADLINAQKSQAQAEQSADTAKAELESIQTRLQDELGEDAAKAVSDTVRSMVSAEMGQRKSDTQAEPQEDPAINRFWNTLKRRVPDFDQVNHSPEFIQWLQTPDPTTGLPIQETLNAAGTDLDVLTVIDVVEQFKRETKPPERAPSPTSPEQQVAPPKKAARKEPAQKPKYTPHDYVTLQEQIRLGMWKGREDEARALERDIHAALTGG